MADDRVNLLVFQDLWSDSHRRYVQSIALKYDLRVFLYSPVEIQAINDGKVVIPIYPFIGAHELPVIMDVKPTEECGRAKIDKVMRRLEPKPRYMFDATVFGSKATDNHDVPIGLDPTIYATMENRVYTPLWDWTDQEVIEACEYFSEEILNPAEYAPDGSRTGSDNGDFVACLNCFEISKKEVYCPKEKGTIPTVLNDAEKNPQV